MKCIGIDFGTSLSSMAVVENGQPVALKTATGDSARGDIYSLPSAVFADPITGNIQVGQAAENGREDNAEYYRNEFKRDFGTRNPYILGKRRLLPQQMCAEILRHFRRIAEEYYDSSQLDRVVLTHPANFSEFKKDILLKAADLAGFVGVELLDEPTAAAICYASRERVAVGEKILVYDLGGGTFDIALIEKTEDYFRQVVPAIGIENMGGSDFDRLILEDIHEKHRALLQPLFYNDGDGDSVDDKLESMQNYVSAELERISFKIKHDLSTQFSAKATLVLPGSGQMLTYSLNRDEFEQKLSRYVRETCDKVEQIVHIANLSMKDIDRVLRVGGSARIPLVVQMLEEVTGHTVKKDVDPELAVCFGAALWAARNSGKKTVDGEVEARRKAEEELKKQEIEAKRKAEEELKWQQAETKRKEEENLKRQEIESKRKAEELRRQEAEIKRKAEEELKRQEAETKRKAEQELKQQQAQIKRKAEEELKRQETETKRNVEERKRQEAEKSQTEKGQQQQEKPKSAGISTKVKYIMATLVVAVGVGGYILMSSGNSTVTMADGGVYTGQVRFGTPSGKGALVYKDGKKYEGQFEKGKVIQGTLTEKDGTEYKGDFVNGMYSGKGILVKPNVFRYTGEFKEGKYDGSGELVNLQYKLTYTGSFQHGLKHGTGKLTNETNKTVIYDGAWQNDKRQGAGISVEPYDNGIIKYNGQWSDDKKHGLGDASVCDSAGKETFRYKGNFKDNIGSRH